MTTLLLINIRRLATMDAARRELSDAAIYIRDKVVEFVGSREEMPADSSRSRD